MTGDVAVAPRETVELAEAEAPLADAGWEAVVWDDPVNLMSYVVYVFREHFGYSQQKSEELMLRVHHRGHAVVAQGGREAMELHVEALHGYGLWATIRKVGDAA